MKYGQAYACRFYCCPDNHVHIVGTSETGEMEYEIVLGPTQQARCLNALKALRTQVFTKVEEV
jgi:hypothetical protein